MKTQAFSAVLLALAFATGFVACQPELLEEPAPLVTPAHLQDGPEIGQSTTPEMVEEGNEIPPQQKWPNPLPAHALLKGFTWSETDYVRFTYNAQGQVAQRYAQWQSVQGDPSHIRKITSDFQYDPQHKLAEVKASDGPVTKYFYQGDRIEKVQQIIPGSGLVREEVTFTTSNGRIAQENRRTVSLATGAITTTRSVFGYDEKGNLNKVESYMQPVNAPADKPFEWYQTILYSDFDHKMNTTSWMLRTPYLPQIRWQFNNPGKMTVLLAKAPTQVTTYTYTYNQQGLPASKTTFEAGVLSTVFYHY